MRGFENFDLNNYIILGIRQRGLQSTEEMLREGVKMTGVGEITTDKAGNLTLQPPADGTPFYLTTMSVGSLLRKLDERRRVYRFVYFK